MNIFEFENQQFDDLWDEESIQRCRNTEPKRSANTQILEADEWADEAYRQFQEANFNEYFDPAKTYKYCLWR